MGAVLTAAARAPLRSLASVAEMTGDFTLTLPVMLAVALATATSRALSYWPLGLRGVIRRSRAALRAGAGAGVEWRVRWWRPLAVFPEGPAASGVPGSGSVERRFAVPGPLELEKAVCLGHQYHAVP